MTAQDHFLLFASTGLGDSIFITPAIRHLKRQLPQSRITVVVKNKISNLFESSPHVDALIGFRNNFWSMWQANRRIRRTGPFRAVFFFHVGYEAIRLVRGAGYQRLYTATKLPDMPSAARIYPMDWMNKRLWEDFADMVAEECGGKNDNHEFEIPLNASAERFAAAFFASLSTPPRPHVGIQLGGSYPGKCWPPERFAAVAQFILRSYGGHIFINAVPSETNLLTRFLASLAPALHSRCTVLPHTSIINFAALVKRLELFVTNDTGPLHVALSQGCPVVALKAHESPIHCCTLPRQTPLRRYLFVCTNAGTSSTALRRSHEAMECITTQSVISEVDEVLRLLKCPVGRARASEDMAWQENARK